MQWVGGVALSAGVGSTINPTSSTPHHQSQPDFNTAITYVSRVKVCWIGLGCMLLFCFAQHHCHPQARYASNRGVYERFLYALRAYRDGQMSRAALCDEVLSSSSHTTSALPPHHHHQPHHSSYRLRACLQINTTCCVIFANSFQILSNPPCMQRHAQHSSQGCGSSQWLLERPHMFNATTTTLYVHMSVARV